MVEKGKQNHCDAELWRLFVNGDESAFGGIYSKYFDVLYHYGFKFTSDVELIKDGLHDLYFDLRKYRNNINISTGDEANLNDTNFLKRYLLKAFRNKLLKKIRWSKHFIEETHHLHEEWAGTQPSHEATQISDQTHELQKTSLVQALTKLTKRQKEAVHLRFFEEVSYEEIANILEMDNVKSARNLIYKALNILKNNIPQHILTFSCLYLGLHL